MDIISRQPTTETPSPANSPSSHGSSTTTAAATPPLTPRPVSRSDPNPYPTTFVQADSTSFKQVVQLLTGSPNPNPNPNPISTQSNSPNSESKVSSIPLIKSQKKHKLYERRNGSSNLKSGLMINPSAAAGFGSPRIHEMLSPSILDFPALVLSPVTPLIEDPFEKLSSPAIRGLSEEERVIAEKGWYLHPSPRAATPVEPRLLPLFPVTSPKSSV